MIDLRLGDCLEEMKTIPDNSVDLVVTSPPYDKLRNYDGYVFNYHYLFKQLLRIIKEGGVAVWVVADQTRNGSETGTSFMQALWAMECGFRLHDTMVWMKDKYIPLTHNRYEQQFEYMFIFSKGKPKTVNHIKVESKHRGKTPKRTFYQNANNSEPTKEHTPQSVLPSKIKGNVWLFNPESKGIGHPAIFPEKLVHDHIISWSNKGEVVLDPFMGSGTTGKVARQLERNFIGIEISPEYFKIAERRINQTMENLL